jgi:hypothetical protein
VIVAIGCLAVLGLSGLSCMGLGAIGYFALRTAPSKVAMESVPEAPSISPVDVLSDAAFLDVRAGPFAAPIAPAAPQAAPSETTQPVVHTAPARIVPRTPVAPPEPSAPEPALIEDEEPIISDEEVRALDAEVQQIQAEKEAEAATETKKKKKNK